MKPISKGLQTIVEYLSVLKGWLIIRKLST
jgi:hypothetical protein